MGAEVKVVPLEWVKNAYLEGYKDGNRVTDWAAQDQNLVAKDWESSKSYSSLADHAPTDEDHTTPASAALTEAIEAYDTAAEHIGSCGDGYCVVKRPVGMHTNGGCRCWSDKYKAQRMMMAAANLRAALVTVGG